MKRTKLVALVVSGIVLLSACKEELICPGGEVDCGGTCVSLLTDRNCGACGNAVGPLQICAAGTPACAPDVAICDGACTDLRDGYCGGCTGVRNG
jgi:hypothetical protein